LKVERGSSHTLIFDFDGVLCNSVEECMVVSFAAYNRMEPSPMKQISQSMRSYFFKYRYLVRPARDFYIIWYSYFNDKGFEKFSFNEIKQMCSNSLEEFQDLFFTIRRKFKKNYNLWVDLNKPYKNTVKYFKTYRRNIFVVTNKDKDSVEIISKAHGYYDSIVDIFSKEISNDKRVLINQLIADHNYVLETDMLYLDDSVENLNAVSSLAIPKFNCFLAKWGYCDHKAISSYHEINDIMEVNGKLIGDTPWVK